MGNDSYCSAIENEISLLEEADSAVPMDIDCVTSFEQCYLCGIQFLPTNCPEEVEMCGHTKCQYCVITSGEGCTLCSSTPASNILNDPSLGLWSPQFHQDSLSEEAEKNCDDSRSSTPTTHRFSPLFTHEDYNPLDCWNLFEESPPSTNVLAKQESIEDSSAGKKSSEEGCSSLEGTAEEYMFSRSSTPTSFSFSPLNSPSVGNFSFDSPIATSKSQSFYGEEAIVHTFDPEKSFSSFDTISALWRPSIQQGILSEDAEEGSEACGRATPTSEGLDPLLPQEIRNFSLNSRPPVPPIAPLSPEELIEHSLVVQKFLSSFDTGKSNSVIASKSDTSDVVLIDEEESNLETGLYDYDDYGESDVPTVDFPVAEKFSDIAKASDTVTSGFPFYKVVNEGKSSLPLAVHDNHNHKKTKPKKKKNKGKKATPRIYDHITVLAGEPPTYQCDACQKMIKSTHAVRYHKFCNQPSDKKRFSCLRCGHGFAFKKEYNSHLRKHECSDRLCPICGQIFSCKIALTDHVIIHKDKNLFVCHKCSQTFKYGKALRTHLKTHTSGKPYTCTICGRGFIKWSNLSNHLPIHSGKTPSLTCHLCGKRCRCKYYLLRHLRSHSSERPFACDRCPKAFKYKKGLSRHLLNHSDESPFECWICGDRFRRKDSVGKHLKTAHNQPQEVDKNETNEVAPKHTIKPCYENEKPLDSTTPIKIIPIKV